MFSSVQCKLQEQISRLDRVFDSKYIVCALRAANGHYQEFVKLLIGNFFRLISKLVINFAEVACWTENGC